MKLYLKYIMIPVMPLFLLLAGCKEDDGLTVIPKNELQNDCIKRSLGPNIVGQDIEFVYAMAIPKTLGKLVSAEVEASIAGSEATYMDNKSYYTNGSGQDVGITVGSKSVSSSGKTSLTFTVDTVAAALRYFYKIPNEARGKEVTFNFSAKASDGQSVSFKMGPYKVAEMEMRLDIPVKDSTAAYISLEDMAVYSYSQAAANSSKIDLVYLYRSIPNITFNHALVAPSNQQYLPGITLPAGVNKSAKIRKEWGLRDYHLARLQYGIYIDDPDFQKLDLTGIPDYAINLRAESGAWIETADGKYRAYVYVNSVNNGSKSAVISIKRYTMK